MQKQELERVKMRQIPSIGTSCLQPKTRVGIIVQRTPKMMQTRTKEMVAETPKFVPRSLNRKSAETPTFNIPLLQTSLRSRLSKITSSKELEDDQQEKAPKFKARPVNKKILESKGQLGLFASKKRPVTIPKEFHFAIDKRIPPPRTSNDAESYDKMELCLESHKKKVIPTKTVPRPFHFRTDKRGAEKEEHIKIPKCSSFSSTIDHPLVCSESESRHDTKPKPFQLDSLMRLKNEFQQKMELRNPLEGEEANTRTLKGDTILVRVRRPLTDVQESNLHVEQRAAIGKTEFHKKFKEKETSTMVQEENSIPHPGVVPSFKLPFLPKKYRSSKGVTKSISPRSNVRIWKDGRRKMVVATATSIVASSMR
uniref:protein TPX2-like n=1 Tax=Erigeron canadensis TaxID=72917 RepID=UPI001CB8B82D|nr:protein TPX2-like [Erigeron canadensis]